MPFSWEEMVAQEEAYLSRVHPTPRDIPSCTSLLDEFVRAYALGGYLRSVYRYGEPRHATHKWEDFKFCMSLKVMGPEERRAKWVRRRAEWWARRRAERSSEDVWDMRREPLTPEDRVDVPPSFREVT